MTNASVTSFSLTIQILWEDVKMVTSLQNHRIWWWWWWWWSSSLIHVTLIVACWWIISRNGELFSNLQCWYTYYQIITSRRDIWSIGCHIL